MSDEQTRWPRVNKMNPCPICGKPDACKVSPDGAVCMCKRIEQGAFKESKGWFFHRLSETPRPDNGQAQRPKAKPQASKAPKAYPDAQAAIEAARKMVERKEKQAASFVAGWSYHNRDGGESLRVIRYALADGDKKYRPIRPAEDGWLIGDPSGPLPLYRLNELSAAGTVWVTEGEKSADAAHKIGLAAVTSAHGSSSAEKSDWAPLAGRQVCILPDNDEPGRKYAQDVARLLVKLDPPARVKIVDLPGLPDKGDVVEYIDARAGESAEAIATSIIALAEAVPFIAAAELIGGLVTRCLADVQAEEVNWLWPGRFALGKLSLIGGVPGVGKSWLSLFIAAAVSRAMPWPDGRGDAPLGSVLIANAEDGAADTIKPRLEAMGADCRRVHVLDCVQRPGENGKMIERGFTLAMAGELEDTIKRIRPLAIVIDPVSAFLADADEHRNGEVRALLKPLARLAEKYSVAIILITHLTKNGGANSVHRMIGSIAFAGAARSVWMVAKDPKNDARRLLLLAKCNIAADDGGLAYTVAKGTIAFEAEPVRQSADEVLAEAETAADDSRPGPEPEARRAAEQWLREQLADGEMATARVKEEALAAGLGWRTVQRAAEAIGVIRQKNAYDKGWEWRVPSRVPSPIESEEPGILASSGNSPENGDSAHAKSQDAKFVYPGILGGDSDGRERGEL